jgi:hypothetical protein
MSSPAEAPESTDEQAFQGWYASRANRLGLDPNPDDPQHFYDYRAAFKAGAEPDSTGHWPSTFKRPGHPRTIVNGVDTKTGDQVAPEGFTGAEPPGHGGPFTLYQDALKPYETVVRKRFGDAGYEKVRTALQKIDQQGSEEYAQFKAAFTNTGDLTKDLAGGKSSLDELTTPVARAVASADLKARLTTLGAPAEIPDAALALSDAKRAELQKDPELWSRYKAFAAKFWAFRTLAQNFDEYAKQFQEQQETLARFSGDKPPTPDQTRRKLQDFLKGAYDDMAKTTEGQPFGPPKDFLPRDMPYTKGQELLNAANRAIVSMRNIKGDLKKTDEILALAYPLLHQEDPGFLGFKKGAPNLEALVGLATLNAAMAPMWGATEAVAAGLIGRTALTGFPAMAARHALGGAGVGATMPTIPLKDWKGRIEAIAVQAGLGAGIGAPFEAATGMAGKALAARVAASGEVKPPPPPSPAQIANNEILERFQVGRQVADQAARDVDSEIARSRDLQAIQRQALEQEVERIQFRRGIEGPNVGFTMRSSGGIEGPKASIPLREETMLPAVVPPEPPNPFRELVDRGMVAIREAPLGEPPKVVLLPGNREVQLGPEGLSGVMQRFEPSVSQPGAVPPKEIARPKTPKMSSTSELADVTPKVAPQRRLGFETPKPFQKAAPTPIPSVPASTTGIVPASSVPPVEPTPIGGTPAEVSVSNASWLARSRRHSPAEAEAPAAGGPTPAPVPDWVTEGGPRPSRKEIIALVAEELGGFPEKEIAKHIDKAGNLKDLPERDRLGSQDFYRALADAHAIVMGKTPPSQFREGPRPESTRIGSSYEESARRMNAAEFRDIITGRQYQSPGVKPRIPIAPIPYEGPVENTLAIARAVDEAADTSVKIVRKRASAAGTYRPSTGAITIAHSTDIPTRLHEVGHNLDHAYSLAVEGPLNNLRPRPDILAELNAIKEFRNTIPKRATPTVRATELWSEFFSAWMLNPQRAEQLAPKAAARLREIPNLEEFQAISERVRKIFGANPALRPSAAIVDPSEVGRYISEKGMPYTAADRWLEFFSSRFQPLRAAERAYEKFTGKKLLPSERVSARLKSVLGHSDSMRAAYERGIPSGIGTIHTDNGRPTNGQWLSEPLARMIRDGTDFKTAKEYEQLAHSVMVAQRALPLHEKLEREVTGVGLGVESEVGPLARAVLEAKKLSPTTVDNMVEFIRRYRVMMDALFRDAVSAGRYSPKVYQAWIDSGMPYTQFARLLQLSADEPLTTGFLNGKSGTPLSRIASPIRETHGSPKEILSPIFTAWAQADKIHAEIKRNDFIGALVKLTKAPVGGESRDLYRLGHEIPEKSATSVTWFDRGEPRYFELDKQLQAAVKHASTANEYLPGFFTGYKRWVQGVVTIDPSFRFVRNFTRGVFSTLLKSGAPGHLGGLIPRDPLAGVKPVRPEIRAQAELNGLAGFGYFPRRVEDWESFMRHEIDRATKDGDIVVNPASKQLGDYAGGAKDWYQKVGTMSELGPILGEYQRQFDHAVKRQKLSPYEAHFYALERSRDLQDFAESSRSIEFLIKTNPFLNAGIRSIEGLRLALVRDPVRVAARGMLAGGALAAAEYAAAERFGYKDRLERLNTIRRDLFLNIPLPGNHWLTLPLPYEMMAFKALAWRMADFWQNHNKDVWDGLGTALIHSGLPANDVGQLLGPFTIPVQLATNYDFFRGGPIIPYEEAKLDVARRKRAVLAADWSKASASAFNKAMHFSGLQVDPRQIDFVVNSLGGGRFTKWRKGEGVEILGVLRNEPGTTRNVDLAYRILESAGMPTSNLSARMRAIREAKTSSQRAAAIEEADKYAKSVIAATAGSR